MFNLASAYGQIDMAKGQSKNIKGSQVDYQTEKTLES